jgi:hypothetical protein
VRVGTVQGSTETKAPAIDQHRAVRCRVRAALLHSRLSLALAPPLFIGLLWPYVRRADGGGVRRVVSRAMRCRGARGGFDARLSVFAETQTFHVNNAHLAGHRTRPPSRPWSRLSFYFVFLFDVYVISDIQ